MKLSDMVPLDQEIEQARQTNPQFRDLWDRTAFAREVATRVTGYRAEHALSQTQLAQTVGMTQSVIARLESGDQPPSLATLAKLSTSTGLEFHLDIAHGVVALTT